VQARDILHDLTHSSILYQGSPLEVVYSCILYIVYIHLYLDKAGLVPRQVNLQIICRRSKFVQN